MSKMSGRSFFLFWCIRLMLRWEYLCGEHAQGLHVLMACAHRPRAYVLMCVRLCLLPSIRPWIHMTYEAFTLVNAVEQVLLKELGRLGALSLQDLGRLNERLQAHKLLNDRGFV